ncbi:MAG: nuclear transport factor 2 family protein [Oscillospiraceae bacterium]|nr:nuclear transport factor 2 family protein [Oscillospiraceae bacterium]
MKELSTMEMLTKWEAQRDIKNLMGKLANCILLNREGEIFDLFWSQERADVCLGFNEGWYAGPEAIRGYYQAERARCALVADCLRRAYPKQLGGKSDQEIYGIGVFKARPLYAPVIEAADDGQTAKGLWYCMGTSAPVDAAGPVANWTWGYYCGDFTKEGGQRRIWHLQYINDVQCISGQSWGRPQTPYPELEEFAPLKDFSMPEPTVKTCLREYYTPLRPMTPAPELPVPYATFDETFSYGMEG